MNMENYGKPWSKTDENLLIRLFNKNLSDVLIAKQLKRSLLSIQRKRTLLNLVRYTNCINHNKRFTPHEDKKILELSHFSNELIAKELKRTNSEIRKRKNFLLNLVNSKK